LSPQPASANTAAAIKMTNAFFLIILLLSAAAPLLIRFCLHYTMSFKNRKAPLHKIWFFMLKNDIVSSYNNVILYQSSEIVDDYPLPFQERCVTIGLTC